MKAEILSIGSELTSGQNLDTNSQWLSLRLAEIGIHAVRAGDNVGEHTIIFAAPGETLELVHKGTSRDSYARGALTAAAFLAGKGAGRYTMADVLGL